jgi:hypothetical protein
MEEHGKVRPVGNPLTKANFGATLGTKKEREAAAPGPARSCVKTRRFSSLVKFQHQAQHIYRYDYRYACLWEATQLSATPIKARGRLLKKPRDSAAFPPHSGRSSARRTATTAVPTATPTLAPSRQEAELASHCQAGATYALGKEEFQT